MSPTDEIRAPFAPSSAATARRELCAALAARGVYGRVADDAALVVSELVSNALRHAMPLPGGGIRVSWRLDGERVEVSVTDGGGPTEPRPGAPSSTATGGRGLAIVESLSDDWGVVHRAGQTTVWAALSLRRSLGPGAAAHFSGGRARRG